MTLLNTGALACVVLTACGGMISNTTDASTDGPSSLEAQPDATADAPCSNATNVQPAPVLLSSGGSCGATTEPIERWSLGGSAPAQYQSDFDSSTSCNGGPSLHLMSSTASSGDFGEMGTGKAPDASWSGHRLRLSGWVLSDATSGWAGLWLRVDSGQMTGIAFDNMQCRAISGTTGWAQYEVVLDVATDATTVAYGILLAGQGSVWLDGVTVEVVDTCVPTTGCP
jgi:hypothetical protein